MENTTRFAYERIFIAIPIPAPTAPELAGVGTGAESWRWHSEANLHLTLRYVGDVDTLLREAIAERLAEIAVEPFILPVENMGIWPARGQPQVIYAGVGSAHPRLYQLQHRVEETLASLGLPLELRAFAPHITLARTSKSSPMEVNQFVKKHREYSAAPFRVDRFCLYRTQHTHYGPEYTALNTYPLKAKSAKAS